MIRAPWVSYFGFTHTPFSKAIPASQLCERPSLQEAVARIRFTVAETQIGVLTGEVGVGKTVAVRAATSQLDPAAHHVIYVPNPSFGARGLYLTIVRALGAVPRFHKAEMIAQAQGLLAAEEQERRRRVVLIMDEAHLLTPEQLEELRLLTNAEMDSQSPFALLLVGQPTLARQLRLGIFAALDQRIGMRYQLTAMDLGESVQYLRHHLALVVALWRGKPDFTARVIPARQSPGDIHGRGAEQGRIDPVVHKRRPQGDLPAGVTRG